MSLAMAVPASLMAKGFSPDLSNLLLSGSRVSFADHSNCLKNNRISSGQQRKSYLDKNVPKNNIAVDKKSTKENMDNLQSGNESPVNSLAQLEALKADLLRKYSAGSHSSSSQKSVPFRIEPLPEGLCEVYDNMNHRVRSGKSHSSKGSAKLAEISENIALLTIDGSSPKYTEDRVYERLDYDKPYVDESVTSDGEKLECFNELSAQFGNLSGHMSSGLYTNRDIKSRTDVMPVGSHKTIDEIIEGVKQHHEKCKMKEEGTTGLKDMGGPVSSISSVQNADFSQKRKKSSKKHSGRRSRHRRKSSKTRHSNHKHVPNLQSNNTSKLLSNSPRIRAELNQIEVFCQPIKVSPVKKTLNAIDKKTDHDKTFLNSTQIAQSVYNASPNLPNSKSSSRKLASLTLIGSSTSSEMQMSASTNSLPTPQTIVERLKASMRKSWEAKTVPVDFGRVTKIYQSEKQSASLNELGMDFPCAPPATPMPDTARKYEIVPCMGDIRAQRAVKLRLEVLEKHEKKKLEKAREEKAKQEKVNLKEKEKETRKMQRMQIYALNKAMTVFEYKNFVNFCITHGVNVQRK